VENKSIEWKGILAYHPKKRSYKVHQIRKEEVEDCFLHARGNEHCKTRNNNMVGVDHISTTKFAFGVTFQSHKA
jgi:uncharacterized protein (UPF0179 family)